MGPNLASKIPKGDTNFEAYTSKANTKLQENPLTENAFLEAFKSLKINKAPAFGEIYVNKIHQIYNYIKKTLFRIFVDSIILEVFPEKLKLAKVIHIFKFGKNELLPNCRPISVLPCFSKILERIMYNRFYEYLTKNNLLFDKQFGFRKGHSTEHALILFTLLFFIYSLFWFGRKSQKRGTVKKCTGLYIPNKYKLKYI